MTVKQIYIQWERLKNNKNDYSKEDLSKEQKRLRSEMKKIMKLNFRLELSEEKAIKKLFRST